MIKTFLRPNIVRCLSHTHSRTFFPENYTKNIEDLIRQQNEILKEINISFSRYGIILSITTTTTIAINYMR